MATKKKSVARKQTPPRPPAAQPFLDPSEVTSASQWRSASKEGFVIELPSGNKARCRRSMNLMSLLEKGKIPNPLAGRIRDMIATKQSAPDLGGDGAEEVLPQLLEFVASQVKRIFIEPRVETVPDDWDEDAINPETEEPYGEWEPSEGAIALDDVSMQDRMYAFAFAQGMALDLESFRREQAEAMATLQDVSRLAPDTSQPATPDGPVPGVLPERSGVDVGSPRRVPAKSGRSGPGQASTASSGEDEGSDGGSGRSLAEGQEEEADTT